MAKRKNQKRRSKKYQVNNRQLKAKRMYKDTIFRMLYHNKENLLSLYNAVNGREYTDPEKLQVVTLENAIYIADEYQRLVVRKSLYSTVIQKIPTPRFLVFYNGTKEVEDRSEFRLSSAYENPTENPDLELRVTMLNVNDGHSSDLMEHCRTLKEYAQYVARVRKYAAKQDVSLEEAVTRAVDECIEEGILAEFLLKNKTEVIKVSIYEYDKEFEEKKLRKAEYEAGRQDGIEIGRQDGIEIGRQDGIEIGRQDGIEIGKRILLEKIIKKKLKKGKSTEQIADELEEDINIIQKVVEKLKSQI